MQGLIAQDGASIGGASFRRARKVPFVVFTDSLSTRVLLSSGAVDRVVEALEENVELVATFDLERYVDYKKLGAGGRTISVTDVRELMRPGELGRRDRIRHLVDKKLDHRIGFYPTAVRHSLIHGFSLERMRWFNSKTFYNRALAWPFPRSRWMLRLMIKWMYGSQRFVFPRLREYMSSNCSALILANLQMHAAQSLILCAQRLGLPIVGHIGSWDHPVGKGVVYPRCRRYIVHNEYMSNALVEYHGIDRRKVQVTGWPQLDPFATKRKRAEYEERLESFGLNPARATVMYCGNSESNAPYEVNYLKRFVNWWCQEASDRFNMLIRPHPRYLINERWKTVYGFLNGRKGLYLQPPSYDDIDELSLLLQHISVVVTNAGTILLDSIVNGRPVVCVLYDEGGPPGSRYAVNNVVGDHYRALMRSGAFYEAYSFEESVGKLDRALARPEELDAARRVISRELVGEVDGRAGERIAQAVVSAVQTEIENRD